MKLSEYKNEEAMVLLADLLMPASKIFSDTKVTDYIRKKRMAEGVQYVLKTHSTALVEILAVLDGVPVDEYECNLLTLPARLVEILNDKELVSFFNSQVQMKEETSSGLAMETSTATDEM